MEDVERAYYKCTACGYKFSRKADIDFNDKCPYCGQQKVVVDKKSEAQDLIEGADKYDF